MQILQSFEHPSLELDDAPATSSLRLSKTPASPHFLERAHNTNCFPIPIDVLPFQTEVFRWAHAGGESDRKDWTVVSFERSRQKHPGLFCGEHAHFTSAETWQLGAVCRILQKKPPSNGLAHGRAKNGMGVAACASRQTAGDHPLICVLHVERSDCG